MNVLNVLHSRTRLLFRTGTTSRVFPCTSTSEVWAWKVHVGTMGSSLSAAVAAMLRYRSQVASIGLQ